MISFFLKKGAKITKYLFWLLTQRKSMKTHWKMHQLSEVVIVFVSLLGILTSHVLCESRRYQPFEVEVHRNSHPHLQPELVRIFENCHKKSGTFDLCMRNAFNELRLYFKTGKFKQLQCAFIHSVIGILSKFTFFKFF